jgi:methylenetetrahydrofolate reductase (NADPH)
MQPDGPIASLLTRGTPVLSVEFFPPKDDEGGKQILAAAGELKQGLAPDFVSITYGAGGATQGRTLLYAKKLREDYGFCVMPHLTCVGATKEQLRSVLGTLRDGGFRNLMTLRGDPPKGQSSFRAVAEGLSHASELVAMVGKEFPEFCMGVAGYPEKHPEAISAEVDLQHLKQKVAQGAHFVTTQLFFDNRYYFDFVTRARRAGITVPIVPGIMPVLSLAQLNRLCVMCGTAIPVGLQNRLSQAGDDVAAQAKVGVDWAFEQVRDLLKSSVPVPGVHLYIMNRSESALKLSARLVQEGVIASRR